MIVFESEKEFENMLCEHLDNNYFLVEDSGIESYDRQTNLGAYGITDLIIHNQELDLDDNKEVFVVSDMLNVVELKITELSSSHLSQIARYKTFFDVTDHGYDVEYTLVCKKSESYNTDLIFLAQSIDWLTIYTYEISLQKGIVFEILGGFSLTKDINLSKTLKSIESIFPVGEV
mgnify:CR=1 FL=1|tara:strand:+ start:16001 stop:16525 length:525 start_codon:yes stop_codon:yes gene_type:complete